MLVGGLVNGYDGIAIAFIFSLIMNIGAYFFSEKIVLYMHKAQPLHADSHPEIYETVQELTQAARLPMPKLWFIESNQPNAFATGRNPHHSSVVLSTGIISLLDKGELRGVLAHELSHIKNRDILISTMAATIASAIGFIADTLRYRAFFSNSDDRKNGQNPLVLILVAILMPLAAALIQLAISRSREYLADEEGARISKDPLALASALEKLTRTSSHARTAEDREISPATAHLFIVNPLHAIDGISFSSLFSTHPPVQKRIERLKKIHERMFRGR